MSETMKLLIERIRHREDMPLPGGVAPAADADLAQRIEARAAIGLEKYGVTLDRRDYRLADWLTHAVEEACDLAGYLECCKRLLRRRYADGEAVREQFGAVHEMQTQVVDVARALEHFIQEEVMRDE